MWINLLSDIAILISVGNYQLELVWFNVFEHGLVFEYRGSQAPQLTILDLPLFWDSRRAIIPPVGNFEQQRFGKAPQNGECRELFKPLLRIASNFCQLTSR